MYVYTVATLVGIYCILTLGLNTITGIAGQISLGHAAFLAITTMGVNFVVVAVFLYFPFFGGAFGIGGIPAPRWFGAVLGKPGFLVLVMAGVLLALAVHLWLLSSWAGLALLATREDEDAAHAAGVDVRAFKIMAFTL